MERVHLSGMFFFLFREFLGKTDDPEPQVNKDLVERMGNSVFKDPKVLRDLLVEMGNPVSQG